MSKRLVVRAALAALGLATAAQAAETSAAPPPFDRGGVKVALVRYLSVGDFYQAYEAGARAQAKALGIDLRIFPGKQDAAQEREQVEQAIALGAQAIVIDHGLPESLKDVARKAVEAGIKVVAFDVNLDDPRIPQVEQSDQALAQKALDQIVQENGTRFEAAYVYVAGFAPLDRRDAVWTAFKAAHPGVIEKARFGTVSDTTASAVADQAKAALRANPGITVIFAPYDEFARGAKLAVNELNLADRVKIYAADISTADIGEITEPRSPWVATVATNPAVVGAVSIRAAALALAGQGPGPRITVEPVLLTQGALREGGVRTIADLNARIPAFGRSEAASAPWIPQPR